MECCNPGLTSRALGITHRKTVLSHLQTLRHLLNHVNEDATDPNSWTIQCMLGREQVNHSPHGYANGIVRAQVLVYFAVAKKGEAPIDGKTDGQLPEIQKLKEK
eukprot:1151362-Pelagomonas_calceolata.AAC.8